MPACPSCGAAFREGARFCITCGQALSLATAGESGLGYSPGSLAPASLERPLAITLLAVLNFLGALVFLGLAAVLLVAVPADEEAARAVIIVCTAVAVLAGGLKILGGVGLLGLKPFGRVQRRHLFLERPVHPLSRGDSALSALFLA